jgi:hypothetical protein
VPNLFTAADLETETNNSGTGCDLGVLAYQDAEPVPAKNPDVWAQDGWMRTPRRRALLHCPVRPVGVVVIGLLAENEPEMPFAGDQESCPGTRGGRWRSTSRRSRSREAPGQVS